MKAKTYFLFCFLIIFMSCEKNDKADPSSFLNKWLGAYEGTSHHWITMPNDSEMVTYNYYKKVHVDVQKSSLDSSLNLTITYNDSIIDSKNNLKFSSSDHHFSQWGDGSGYGSLTVNFNSDSLHYKFFQMCGIPCSSGIDFNLKKK
jgi:hypothetical protein